MDNDELKKWHKFKRAENKREEHKEKIKNAFIDSKKVEVIPAIINNNNGGGLLRVAAYCRVSTYEESQAGSFEL